MSPVPGATSVAATVPTPTPSTATVTIATTTTSTTTSSAPNRNPTMSSQQQSSPSRSQHGSSDGNVNGSAAASMNKHHYNNNNSIKSTNCNNNNNNNSGKIAQSHNNNSNKVTMQHRNGGMSFERVGSVQQMKQQQQHQQKQQQQQQQQQQNKNTSNAMKARTNDMQKQTIAAKSSFTHANTPKLNTVNGAATKSLKNTEFSTPVVSAVGTSSQLSSSSSYAQTNCSTKSLTTTTTTTSSIATTSTQSLDADPLTLPAIKCNGVTSTPAAVVTNAQTTINSTINQDDMEIKEERDPQVILKAEESSTTKTITISAAATTTTTTQKTTPIVNQKATPPTTTSNRKDSTVVTLAEAKKSKQNASSSHTTSHDASEDNLNLIVDKPRKVLLSVMNSHIICHLCNGYLIDATTIVECLHSFCHSCLIKHLRMEQYCPRCEMMINTAKPNIKPDTTLQAIVYKLVPGLYERELMRKRAFYKDRPEDAAMATPEQRGEDTEHLIFSPSDYMSLSLEFADTDELVRKNSDYGELLKPRYLQCPAMCTVGHLKKFVYGKFDIDVQRFNIDLMYKVKTIVLLDHYTLMDVAYIYTWKRDAPMRYYFRVKRNLRPVVKVRKPAPLLPVEVKDEVAEVSQSIAIIPKITGAEITQTTDTVPDAMTIIPKPVVSTLNVIEPLIKTPNYIKEEEVEVPEEAKSKANLETGTKPVKTAKPVKSPVVSSSTDGKRSQATTSAERKAEKAQHAHHPYSSPKTSKEKREAKEALKHATESPREERKVENIKLKIDLSKHNSVTIINMSDPHRREITKPVRPEKEWKLKSKKDKDSSPKHLLSGERKSKTPSPLTVPPITIKAEQISPQTKVSPLSKNSPRLGEKSPEATSSYEDEEKSQFLKSFSLTPIKSVKTESPDHSPKSPKSNLIQTHKIVVKSPTSAAREPLKTTISTIYKGSALPVKRKIKEPSKNVVKKPKLSPPLPVEDFKIKLPSQSPNNNATKPNATPVSKPNPIVNDKPLISPPTLTTNLTSATTNSDTTLLTTTTTTASNNQAIMRPPISVPPKKPTGKLGNAGPKINSMAPPPQPFPRIEMAAPGNRTPIAKRYQPILPKSSRPNPFANIPSDVNRLLKDAGTEIKSIASNAKSKVYGPKTTTSATTITPENNLMGPPPVPTKSQAQNVNQSRLGGAVNANKSAVKNGKSSNANNYLNLALYNASKTKGNEAPPGCRTPIYTPNSPIYSPSSPQYMPNYNIPTVPTYKYTPRPSGGSGSFLQSILGGSNNQMAGLFPAPPTKKDSSNTNVNSTTGRSSPSHVGNQIQAPKRVYPFARSPSPEDPPEKQLKVKSLLTSCNINIPSSLSITITREDSESQTNNASHPKHKSPVNNYIEILKLPDQSVETAEQNKRASPPTQKLPPTPHASSSLKLLMPPTVNTTTADSTAKRDNAETKPASYGGSNLTHMSQKSQNNMPASKSAFSNAPNNLSKSSTTASKSPKSNSTSVQANQKNTHDNSQQKSSLKATESQKSPLSEQQKSGTEKKSPNQSPEKNINSSPNAKSAHKSPSSSSASDSSKKFRPILPRQSPATAISEVVPPKVTTANIIGTYSSPGGVAVKIHANKKVSPPKKSPGTQQPQQSQQQPQVAHQQPKSGHSPNSAKNGASQSNKSPSPAHQSSSKLPPNSKSTGTPPPSTPSNANANTNSNKMMHSPHPGMPQAMPSLPSLSSMPNLPPTPLQVAAMAAGLPGIPSHLSGLSAADFSKLFKDNLLRAQVQAAAAASQPGGMFYPYANPQQLSHHYSYQQAFMLEQLSRMQRAEALNEFMHKLKNGTTENPSLENIASGVGGTKSTAVAGSKASPVVTSTGNATSKSNSVNSKASSVTANSSSGSGSNSSATKAK